MNQPKPRQISWLDSAEHRDWLAKHREALLDFFQPEVVLPAERATPTSIREATPCPGWDRSCGWERECCTASP